MERPNRPPDLILQDDDYFWFDEKIEFYGSFGAYCFLAFRKNNIYYKHYWNTSWTIVTQNSYCGKLLYPAYKKWLISKHLKEKLK